MMFFDYAHPGCHFYPRSPCGERQSIFKNNILCSSFLSTLSLRRATFVKQKFNTGSPFLSTLSLRRATVGDVWACRWPDISIHALLAESDNGYGQYCIRARISIHALLAESDKHHSLNLPSSPIISIHALLAESDYKPFTARFALAIFLSTLSLRRATIR